MVLCMSDPARRSRAEILIGRPNRAIVHELLEWFREPGQLDLRCQMQGKTALHLAAEYGNVGVAEELIKADADNSFRCEMEETPADMARRVFAQKKILGGKKPDTSRTKLSRKDGHTTMTKNDTD